MDYIALVWEGERSVLASLLLGLVGLFPAVDVCGFV